MLNQTLSIAAFAIIASVKNLPVSLDSHKTKGSIISGPTPLIIMKTENLQYLKFLAYCLDEQKEVPDMTGMNWRGLYQFCQEQAIVGIVLAGIDRLSKSRKVEVPQDLLFEWIGQANMIESQNKLVDQRVKELTEYLNQQGLKCCILKGQGNALMYPHPGMRTPGDIDVWIKGTKKDVAYFVHQRFPDMNVQYHHMNYPIFDDIEVEVHYYPSFCYNKWHNYRLQQYFREISEAQFKNANSEGYVVPTNAFNLVFQLSHMMRHFFTQGIGLRHAIDYYYLLRQEILDADKQEAVSVMKRCGMYKFFCAVLWLEKDILGLDKNKDIAKVNEKVGKLVLHEMLKGGNFGRQYIQRHENIIATYIKQMTYRLRFVSEFPSEPLFRPFALTWDYLKKHWI